MFFNRLKNIALFRCILITGSFLSLLFFHSAASAYVLRLIVNQNPPGIFNGHYLDSCVGIYGGNMGYQTCGTDLPITYSTGSDPLQDIYMWVRLASNDSNPQITLDNSCNANGFMPTSESNEGVVTLTFSRPGNLDPQGKWGSLFLTVTIQSESPDPGPISYATCQYDLLPN